MEPTTTPEVYCEPEKYTFKNFLPLILAFCIVFLFVAIRQTVLVQFSLEFALLDFLAGFFIVFSLMKFLDWKGFVTGFRSYDVFAKRSALYGWLYPVIELFLGIMFYAGVNIGIAAIITVTIAFMSSIGVSQQLAQKKRLPCVCLGTVFSMPLSYFTLLENLLTGFAAALLLTLI